MFSAARKSWPKRRRRSLGPINGESRDLTLKALKELNADGRFTMADVKELDAFTPIIKARLDSQKADTLSAATEDLGLGLASVDPIPTDDLGLGLAAVDDAGLGLDLPTVAATDQTVIGSAGDDDLGLGLPSAPSDSVPSETEDLPFSPSEDRCRDCVINFVSDFESQPSILQAKLVSRLVDLENAAQCPSDEIDETIVRDECAKEIRKFDTIADDGAQVDTEQQREDSAVADEAEQRDIEEAADAKNAETQLHIKEYLDNLGGQLTLSQIEEALTKCSQYEDQDAYANVSSALNQVKNDLRSVNSIVPPDNPEEAAVLRTIIASTPVDWRAPSPAVRYQAIITATDAGNLSEDTKRRAQAALGIRLATPPRINSGSDVEDALANGRGTETRYRTERVEEPPGSGQYVSKQVPYDVPLDFDEDNPLEVRPGVDAYKKGNREIMKATAGHNVPAEIDVTGWSAEQKGDLAEVM